MGEGGCFEDRMRQQLWRSQTPARAGLWCCRHRLGPGAAGPDGLDGQELPPAPGPSRATSTQPGWPSTLPRRLPDSREPAQAAAPTRAVSAPVSAPIPAPGLQDPLPSVPNTLTLSTPNPVHPAPPLLCTQRSSTLNLCTHCPSTPSSLHPCLPAPSTPNPVHPAPPLLCIQRSSTQSPSSMHPAPLILHTPSPASRHPPLCTQCSCMQWVLPCLHPLPAGRKQVLPPISQHPTLAAALAGCPGLHHPDRDDRALKGRRCFPGGTQLHPWVGGTPSRSHQDAGWMPRAAGASTHWGQPPCGNTHGWPRGSRRCQHRVLMGARVLGSCHVPGSRRDPLRVWQDHGEPQLGTHGHMDTSTGTRGSPTAHRHRTTLQPSSLQSSPVQPCSVQPGLPQINPAQPSSGWLSPVQPSPRQPG